MGRPKRVALGGYVYHVLNRANGRLRIFRKKADFVAFEAILAEGIERFDMRICGYCIMSNRWHLLLWPREDGDLSDYMRWITVTHTQRYHASHGTVGIGHLYQGRYKSFPTQDDDHYLTVLRYIEANPLRAKIVERPSGYPWSSFAAHKGLEKPFALSDSPVALPPNWTQLVSRNMAVAVHDGISNSIRRGAPLGDPDWIKRTAVKLNLESTTRPRGRPKNSTGHL
jgi:putative transposase